MRSSLLSGWLVAMAVASSTPAPLQAQEKKEPTGQMLVAFGASVGGLLFESHDKIAVCEKAIAKDPTIANDVVTKLAITANIQKVLIANLVKAREDKLLSDSDRAFVDKATETAKLVQEEANALKTYISSKDEKDAAHYREVRKKADVEIRLILGIKN